MARTETPLTHQKIADTIGVDRSYVSKVMNGARPMSVEFALSLHRNFALKLGPLCNRSDEEIAEIRRVTEMLAAPKDGAAA